MVDMDKHRVRTVGLEIWLIVKIIQLLSLRLFCAFTIERLGRHNDEGSKGTVGQEARKSE